MTKPKPFINAPADPRQDRMDNTVPTPAHLTTGSNPAGPCIFGSVDADARPVSKAPELDLADGFRVANTPAGLLSLRDPERLRRYLLGATDEAEQERRQRELLEIASNALSFWPAGASDVGAAQTCWRPKSRVANVGLWAWPVLVSHANFASVKQTFDFGPGGSGSLAGEVTRAWAMAIGVPVVDVRIEGAVSVGRLTDLSPLMLQSALSRESQRNNALVGGEVGAASPVPLKPGAATTLPWSLALAPSDENMSQFAPDRPLVFLLTAFVAWDHDLAHPRRNPELQEARARMGQLMRALFTKGYVAPVRTENADGLGSNSRGVVGLPERQALVPVIFVGQPQTLYEAVTQGQWMQLAWMAERARRTGRQFTLSQHQLGSYVTWVARIEPDADEEDQKTELRYTYDGFWRPLGHVQAIHRCVDQAQGSGQMPGEDFLKPVEH